MGLICPLSASLLCLYFILVILLLYLLDEPRVTLSEKCRGEVRINNVSVCEDQWDSEYSKLVCLEQGCSNPFSFDQKPSNPDEEYHHVRCEGYHHRLGQCSRFRGTCRKNLVNVYCVGES